MNKNQSDKQTNESDKTKSERTVYRNLFERSQFNKKEKIKEKIVF
jgi:hypothetical protein